MIIIQMNDSNVSRVQEERVLNQNAYILFYVKMKNGKPVLEDPKKEMLEMET